MGRGDGREIRKGGGKGGGGGIGVRRGDKGLTDC